MDKTKSTNLHDFQYELFLGFNSQQPLKKTQYEISYIGGQPLWLYEPNQKLLNCDECKDQSLTFIGQIFCPLNAEHCYNRIMYLFYCEKCKRQFRCIKQQTDKNWQPKVIQSKKYKIITQQSFEIQSDSIQRKQMLKIINRSKIQVQQQIIMQQQDENDEEEQGQQIITVQKMSISQMQNKLNSIQKQKRNKQYTQKQMDQINKKFQSLNIKQEQKQGQIQKQKQGKQIQGIKKDFLFEQYIRTIKTLNNPIMIYSNIPIPYNKTSLNPKHSCKYCGNKLQLQIQLTQKILLFQKSLAILDWGSIFIYSCTSSCKQSQDENVVLQYEFDAVSQDEIAKLRKTKKNRKKNKNKSLSKQKKKILNQNQKIQPTIIKNTKQQGSDQKQAQGDWD